jgi:rhomboid protease GluP
MTEGWTEIVRSPHPSGASDAGLVLLAVGITCIMTQDAGGYALLVDGRDVARAQGELRRYADENRPAPVAPVAILHPGALGWSLVAMAVMWLIALASSRHWLGRDWIDSGALVSLPVQAGAWWRAVCALTLHTNIAHLAANTGFGLLFGAACAALYGPGVGWLLILASGALANLAEAYALPGASAIGASTAVFAALGLVAARAPLGRRGVRLGHGAHAAIVAAALLLALIGTGDDHTDIAGHALGFAAGLAAGLALRPIRVFPPSLQRICGGVSLAVVGGCWALALAAG